jgi:hypothetical protein
MRGRTMRPRRQDLTCPGARPTRQNRAFAERVAANTFAVGPPRRTAEPRHAKFIAPLAERTYSAGLFA